MEGTTRATTGREGLHQIVYRWQHRDLFGHKGLGPVATSLPIADLARLAPDVAPAVTAEFGGDGAPLASTSFVHVDSFAAVVHRAAAEYEGGRLVNDAHVLLGTRGELTPHAVLALDGWSWRSGGPGLAEIPVGRPLGRVPREILDDALAERAFALRDAARRRADALIVLLAAVLRRPTSGFSLRLADCGGDPVALLWGLFDLVTVPLPGPLTFSTYEIDDETSRPRFVVVPRWPPQLPSGRYRVDPETEARTDVFRDAAERMVERYVADDWDTMYPLLRGLQELRRSAPYDRAAAIRERLGGGEEFAVPAGPGPRPEREPTEPPEAAEAPRTRETPAVAEPDPRRDAPRATPAAAHPPAVAPDPEPPAPEPPAPALAEPEAFPRAPVAAPERPEEPPPSAGPADRERWKRRGVYDEDIDALEFATDQLSAGGADRAVAFVEDVVALAVALELADVRLLPYIAEHLPSRFDDAPKWSHRERQAVRHVLLHPVRYGDRLAEAGVAPPVVRRLFDRLVRVVLSLEKDPVKVLRVLARELMSERRKLAPYPVLDDVLRRSSWEQAYHRELGRRWAELNPPWADGG
ncbi:hypothetical protein LO772_25815 [Yinghuangia sp. ASG 101]|uniref:hypothetical protein n=1 Tax=Yinghuangia sp. ASG 101 TaxID=2896848 RepID=UPI001E4C9FE0|nr:hypothetical protein [Yinghuangia sp. ASG 101]UGQ10261.1 hypothetical protein LO772_25815 [Yinghuangia sp. ASG 101]